MELASEVYRLGADAIIVQDLGLAKYIIKNMPDIDVHASTQMSIHNLQGVLALQTLGFKRVVLARELSLAEIEYICANSNIEIEAFVHGAICISYSGQCLFSSSIGGRSGNRGKCAQPCRLPYELVDENSISLDKGYLLSPKDLCSLKYLPSLIKAGVTCFKIEGRMKTPEYVSVVTSIYRKYIDLALSDKPYIVDDSDIKKLMQVFNRGGFSTGNFSSDENINYVYKKKPNNMGLYIGNISHFNKDKGLITFKTNDSLSIGDTISLENEEHKYTVTELMKNKQNIAKATIGDTITIGRMKGKIKLGDEIYKLSSKSLSKSVKDFISLQNVKIPLVAKIIVRKGVPITLEVTSLDKGNYFSMSVTKKSEVCPISAISSPISKERILEQLNKTTNTQFEFKYINIDLENNVYIPKIALINKLRRDCLEALENEVINRFTRKSLEPNENLVTDTSTKPSNFKNESKYSILLNELYTSYDYSKLECADRIYLPLKFFAKKEFESIIYTLAEKGKLYIYMPTIIKENYKNIIYNSLDNYISKYGISGIVVSNISSIHTLSKYLGKLELIGNYTLNIFNAQTILELSKHGISTACLSPELDKKSLYDLCANSSIETEIIAYGRLPLMNMGYCLLGSSNKCYPTCDTKCMNPVKYYLKDRLGYKFRIIPDNIQTVTTLYNSKITSIPYSEVNPSSVRISLLDESIDEINHILKTIKSKSSFTGKDFTNGNFNRII